MEMYMEQNSSCSVPLSIAWDKCEEILDKYATEWGPLFKGGSVLGSTPSLVTFAALYSGVATLGWKLWPEKRNQILSQIERLQPTLEKYRDATITFRLSYVENGLFRGYCENHCYDGFYKVTRCESCYRVQCDSGGLKRYQYDISLFRRYKREDKYFEYFSLPINKLAEFRSQLKEKMV
ncbi:uncharacterized protein LOC118438680 [Folsomia candida]|nr:uncharacterized protein LOC118438680 [Folsomia candida]